MMPSRRLTIADRVVAAFACVLLVALLGDVTLGVITRGLGEPLIWTDEAARMLMVWLACFGWILCSRRQLHVRIRYLQDKLPRRLRQSVDCAIQAGLAALGLTVAVQGVVLMRNGWGLAATTLPVSAAWLYAPLVPAGMVTAAQAAADIAAVLRGRSRIAEPVPR